MTEAGLLSRRVLADQIRDRLLEWIVDGRYPPDARIVETQVARELGTSQGPVREALRALEGLGFVEITPFRGARVRRPARREIVEAYVVRSTLEVLAARLGVERLTDAALGELTTEFEAMETAAASGDGHGVAQHDARFHARIVELADNATLLRVWRSLEPYARTYLTLVAPGADPQWSADLHAPILDAFAGRDADAAAAALRDHFDEVSDRMATRWPDAGDGTR